MIKIRTKFYENTENELPHPITKEFIKMNIEPSNAIDLGCGTGRDTVYLIKNGWQVLAIDRENIEEIINSKLNEEEIKKNGYFIGNFFGLNDSWVKIKEQMVFLSKEQVMKVFENSFEIVKFNEIEKDGKTGLGKMKHWHTYNVIAKKK